MNKKVYHCYSPRMQEFISSNGIKFIEMKINKKTKLVYWDYELNDELSAILNEWTNNKSFSHTS